jgi:hypothetical protein
LQGHPNDAVQARQSAAATRNPHQEIRALQQLGGMAYQKGDPICRRIDSASAG